MIDKKKKFYFFYWKQIDAAINDRTQRERIFLLITGIVLIWAILFELFIGSLNEKKNALKEQKQALIAQYEKIRKASVETKKEDQLLKNESIENLEKMVLNQNERLKKLDHFLMTSDQMLFWLQEILKNFSGLDVQNIKILPLNVNADLDKNSLDRQRVKITFLGKYEELFEYLQRIERLPFPLLWEDLEYKIKKYPIAEIAITFYVLQKKEDDELKKWDRQDEEIKIR